MGASPERRSRPWAWLALAAAAPAVATIWWQGSVYSLYLLYAPIVVVVYEKIVAGRVAPGVRAFLASLVLALPLSIVVARLLALVFEIPFLHHRSSPRAFRRQQARAEGARR